MTTILRDYTILTYNSTKSYEVNRALSELTEGNLFRGHYVTLRSVGSNFD